MEIVIERESFAKTLSYGGSLASEKQALPILSCAKFYFYENGVYTIESCKNGEACVVARGFCNCQENDFSFCADASTMIRMLSNIKDHEVKLVVDSNAVTIFHKKGKMELPCLDAKEFPSRLNSSYALEKKVNKDILAQFVVEASKFVSNDFALRANMCGLYMYFEEGEFGVTATNSRYLYTNHIDTKDYETNANAIVNSKIAPQIIDMCKNTRQEEILIKFSDSMVEFTSDNYKVCCTKIDGRYPPFKKILPQKSSNIVNCSKNDFLDSLKRVSCTSNDKKTIKLSFIKDEAKCKVESENIDFSRLAQDEFEISSINEDMTIGFNQDMLLTCLNCIQDDDVVIKMTQRDKAVLFMEDSSPNKIVLLMPQRLD